MTLVIRRTSIGHLWTLACLTTWVLGLACSSHRRSVQRDPSVLDKIVHLPFAPQEVWFASVPRGKGGGLGPDDLTLIAVMRFDRPTLDRFTATSNLREEEPWLPIADVADWLPPQVRAALRPIHDQRVQIEGRCFDGRQFLRRSANSATICVLRDVPFVIFRRPQDSS